MEEHNRALELEANKKPINEANVKPTDDSTPKGKPTEDLSAWTSQREDLIRQFELSRKKMISDHQRMIEDLQAKLKATEDKLRGGSQQESPEMRTPSGVDPQIHPTSSASSHIRGPRQLTHDDLLRIEAEETAAFAEEEKRARERIRRQLRRDTVFSDQGTSSSHMLPEDDHHYEPKNTSSFAQRAHYMSAHVWREVEELELQIARMEAEQRVERLSYREGDLEVLRLRLRDRKRQLFVW